VRIGRSQLSCLARTFSTARWQALGGAATAHHKALGRGRAWTKDSARVTAALDALGLDDFEVAEATYRAAVARWPAARITLRQGARIVHEGGQHVTS
jgi:hypothetical protein